VNERERRVGENEALFREVNERIEELDATFGVQRREFTIVCECGLVTCAEHIAIAHDEYRELRENPTWFALIPGHEDTSVESVIDERHGYLIVQKHEGGPAEVARELNPRE
jgi:hypothetical protein